MSENSFPQPLQEITVEELAIYPQQPDLSRQFIDVREPAEVAIASLPDFTNLPLSEFSQWSQNIHTNFDPEAETIVICHHGMRSAQMCHWLQTQGFTNVKNVRGGIDAYSVLVDPKVPRY